PAAAVADAFHKLGIDMTYQAAQPTATGIVAPILSFRTTLPAVPDNPTALSGPTTVTVDVGRVTTSVTGQAGPAASGGTGVAPAAAPKLARALARTIDARNVYVVFVAVAGIGLAAASLVRKVGVTF